MDEIEQTGDFGQPSGQREDNRSSQNNSSQVKTKKRRGWRIFWSIFTILSVIANIILLLIVIGLAAFFAAGQRDILTEEVIYSGPKTAKIVVISVEGIIEDEQARFISKQLKSAGSDSKVKGVVIRVNSPGGGMSASDRIYNEISNFRANTGKPVVAFMEGIAASGGYYTSLACDRIVAEPTAITGSIGVIMDYFVFQGLLEEKLGVLPVVIKSGLKKDWPSPFTPPTEEQRKYLEEKLIVPAYQRFVEVVASRRTHIALDDVKRLADGSIFNSTEALNEKLIDKIGYFDEAVSQAKSLAGVKDAQVVEYHKLFSFSDFIGAGSKSFNFTKIDRKLLREFSTPEVLYIWCP